VRRQGRREEARAGSERADPTFNTFALERAQARAIAEAGVAYAVQKLLLQVDPENPWPIEGSVREWSFGAGTVYISVVDSSGMIDLNHADRALLEGLLVYQGGVAQEEVDALLDAIEDWRDPDDLKRLNGAEEDEYLAAGRTAGPKNAPFESVEELQQVLGVTTAIYEKLFEFITVSGHKGVNPEAASLEVLSAVPDIDPQLVMDYVQQRTASIAADVPLPPAPPLGEYLSQAKGLAYHINVEARLETGTRTAVKAVVTQARRPGQVFHIIAWHEG
jgi:general secretion pathway protein K